MLTQDVSPQITKLVSFFAMLAFLPLLFLGVYESVNLFVRATGTKANIVVDAKTILEPINTNFYHAFAQGGEEATDQLASIIPEIKALQPKLIRVDHLYDYYDVVSKNGDTLSFNFNRLDQVINSILATGAKPVLALSYMPPAIAKDRIVINPPTNWDDWSLVVQKTIEHYSGKTDKNLTGIYYEVWNEPDLAQFGSWKTSGEKNYLTLYGYAATGAKNAKNTNQFFLGGPSTTGLYKNWILALAQNKLRVDFFSWHSYLADPGQYRLDQRNLVSWLLPFPNRILTPTLITEFGFTGAKDKRYGTKYASAHAAAVIQQLFVAGPTYLFSFQLKDGPGQTDGSGWGLISHDSAGKAKKSRYSLYSFLDQMAGFRLHHTGDGTWVTATATNKDGINRVLLVNFDRTGSHSENVPVTFVNLVPGQYTLRERLHQGLDVKNTLTVEQSFLRKEIFLPAQSVAILELQKIK